MDNNYGNTFDTSSEVVKVSLKKDIYRYGTQGANIVPLPQMYLTHADCVVRRSAGNVETADYNFVVRLHSDRSFNLRSLDWELRATLTHGDDVVDEWSFGGLQPYAFPNTGYANWAQDITFGEPVTFINLMVSGLPHDGKEYRLHVHFNTVNTAYHLEDEGITVDFKTPVYEVTPNKIDAPTNFKYNITADGKYVELSWDPVNRATFYKIHARFDEKAFDLGFLTQLEYDFVVLENSLVLGTNGWPPGIACTLALQAYTGTEDFAKLSDAAQIVVTRPGAVHAHRPADEWKDETFQQSITYVTDGKKRRLAIAYIKTIDADGNPVWRTTT